MRFRFVFFLAPVIAAGADCTFRVNPDEYLAREARARRAVYDLALKVRPRSASIGRNVPASEIPRRNFVDDEIFGVLDRNSVPSAPLTTDEEFLRRVFYDLTGHPPSAREVREFLDDSSETKRNDVIDRLVYSPRFVDKWTMWLGDLLQNVTFPQNFDRQYDGRNAFYLWMRSFIASEKSLRDMAYELVSSTGNSYKSEEGASNFLLNSITPMGPIQDTYDNGLNRAASTFLGLSHYDCLLCHNGRSHLDQISLWGARATRLEAQRMAAFFSRTQMVKPRVPTSDFFYNSFNVSDATSGGYNLNTNYGNRPNREPIGELRAIQPEYRNGETPKDNNWRAAFAASMVDDPMFARNFANRLWKELFNLALVEPVDSLDPARLDPSNPPDAPWTLQATHPELLDKLANDLRERNYNLREFLKTLVQSSAYQLSSRYDAEWKIDYGPMFARHYPRRLEGEEIHDTLVKASGLQVVYAVRGLDSTPWAMQMPEPVEPRSNGTAVGFMLAFLRGNRDTQFRMQDGSILQQLTLMNSTFVLDRIRVSTAPSIRALSQITSDEDLVTELFLTFLARRPNEQEKAQALKLLSDAGNQRGNLIEDLAWVLVNKVDFLYNY